MGEIKFHEKCLHSVGSSWTLECAFVGLDHCSSIFTALTSILVPPGPLLSFLGLHLHCSLLHPPLELPRLLVKQPRQPPASRPRPSLLPLPGKLTPQISTQLAPSLFAPRLHCHLLKKVLPAHLVKAEHLALFFFLVPTIT